MILITGGCGFIGLHTARALLDLGESCVLTRHRAGPEPELIGDEVGKRIFIEALDIADAAAFAAIGERHDISGIVHLAAPGLGTLGLFDDFRVNLQGLLNTLEAADRWEVPRITIASSIGVYLGIRESPLREEQPLPMMGVQPIEAVKKSFELLGTFIGRRVGLEVVNARFAAVWGPLGRAESRFFATPGLVHSAVAGEAAGSPTAGAPVYAEDGIDHCYVKDCGRGIGLLQTAARLNHTTYNVGSGRATKNRQVAAAIMRAIPTAGVDLVEGRSPEGPGFDPYVDISRIHQDTGFEPEYDVERGVADYIEWLRSGHER